MEKYSAGYAYTNYNFVIQNINKAREINNKYYPLICVIKNIIQRGCPTNMSDYLADKIGHIDLEKKRIFALIDKESPKWINTIKGNEEKNIYPAKLFFEKIIPEFFLGYEFIQQLTIPEAQINDIVETDNLEFENQQVDFYIHQCKLVIEIDGCQHDEEVQTIKDEERDEYLNKYGILTVRISTKEINEKNEAFLKKIALIISRLKQYDKILTLYKNYFTADNYDEEMIKHLKANAVIRTQITILSLLEKGILKLDDEFWKINILERDISGFLEIAIEDLFIWFDNLSKIGEVHFKKPNIDIIECLYPAEFVYMKDYINIDFSLNKRWTDENILNEKTIYVRTDYYDGRRYFRLSAADSICYKINKEDNKCIDSLKFFLKNIFGHDEFRDGQLPIIVNSLQGEDTIGILPTGTGKSICYQLTALLQPCVSFVVCPIKSLIYDQRTNLADRHITNVQSITGDMSGEQKDIIMALFANEKYQLIFISPERFQVKRFRESLASLNYNSNIGLAVIDEVHCLSEWGHDFRTSYLNLIKTIRKFTPSARLLGLTATASNFVLQDIKKEFEVDSYNIKTLSSFTRPELKFKVIKCEGEENKTKKDKLFELLTRLNESMNVFKLDNKNTKSGIIFTPTVNGTKGCYGLSRDINNKFKINSEFYSGEAPKIRKVPIMDSKKFNNYKNEVQNKFKINQIPLLVSTKAFGMGVDKPNIRYTIHFGVPMSLESLYQEAGRAGRDKEDAECYVLYSHEIIEENILNKFYNLDTPVEELKEIQEHIDYKEQRDILGNFFLWLSNNKGIEYEFGIIKKVYEVYAKPYSTQKISCKKLGYSFSDIQKAIYRLSVIGIVEDWTIEIWDSNKGVLEVTFNELDTNAMYQCMENYIKKYHKEFSLEKLKTRNDSLYGTKTYSEMLKILVSNTICEIEKIIKSLLVWIYDNIVYTRRQSMKTISQLCNEFKDGSEFKYAIERHFKFDDDTYILDNIAEKPTEYKKWFEIIKNERGMIDKNKSENLKRSLGRFLESYRYNTGLNYISGIVRLILDDYNDLDGRQRLESAFKQIQSYEEKEKNEILEFSLHVGSELSDKNKLYLSELLCANYPDKLKIYEGLGDEYSLMQIVDETNCKLKNIARMIKW